MGYIFVLLAFAASLSVSYFLTPVMRMIAIKSRLLSMPGRRRIHSIPKPYLGGIAIYCAFITGIALIYFAPYPVSVNMAQKLKGLAIACTFIVLLGLWDDIKNMRPIVKLAGQLIAGLVLFGHGLRVEISTSGLLPCRVVFPAVLDAFVTLAWFIGIINAMNLIDGLDGLAAGITVIASESLIFISLYNGDRLSAFLLAALCGSALGFLKYNFHPAKIFMGDSGSMLLGIVFASIALFGYQQKSVTAVSLLVPLTALSIPVFDTLVAIARRISQKKSIFKADRKHIHHRLLDMGLTQKQIVLWLYVVTAYLGLFSFLFTLIPPEHAFILLLLLLTGLLMAARTFEFIEKKIKLICRLEKELDEK